MVMFPPAMSDSGSLPCFHGCPAFLHRYFPPQSPPSRPLAPSLHSQQQPSPWDCSTVPKLQLPATGPSRGPAFLSSICMAAARTVWLSHLGCHRSAVSLSALNVSPLTQTVAPTWGSHPYFSCPTCREGRSRPTITPVSPPGSFFPPSFAWFYIFFSSGQVLLSALSWYSACTSVFEVVFLMYPWRAMWSTSTYSSTNLFSECWALSQLFHSPLSLSSRGSLVPLHFLP